MVYKNIETYGNTSLRTLNNSQKKNDKEEINLEKLFFTIKGSQHKRRFRVIDFYHCLRRYSRDCVKNLNKIQIEQH